MKFEIVTLISPRLARLTIFPAVVCIKLTTDNAPASANIFAILAHLPICSVTYSFHNSILLNTAETQMTAIFYKLIN